MYHEIESNRVLVQLTSYPVECLKCSQFNHLASNCPKSNTFASKVAANQMIADEEIAYSENVLAEDNLVDQQKSSEKTLAVEIMEETAAAAVSTPENVKNLDNMEILGTPKKNLFGDKTENHKTFINIENLSNAQSLTTKNVRCSDDSSSYIYLKKLTHILIHIFLLWL